MKDRSLTPSLVLSTPLVNSGTTPLLATLEAHGTTRSEPTRELLRQRNDGGLLLTGEKRTRRPIRQLP